MPKQTPNPETAVRIGSVVTTQSVTAIKLNLVGAGRARDDGAIYSTRARIAAFVPLSLRERAGVREFKNAQFMTVFSITLQSLCKYRGRGPLLRSSDAERGSPKRKLLLMESLQ